MSELKQLIESVNKILNETIYIPEHFLDRTKLLNGLDEERIKLIIDGEPNSDDYWYTEPSLMNKVLSKIKKLDEEAIDVAYYDADGTEQKTAVILDIENAFFKGYIIVSLKDKTEFSIDMKNSIFNKNIEDIIYYLNKLEEILNDN